MANQEIKQASLESMKDFFERISGKNIYGEPKAHISYQTFDIDDDEESKDKQTIYYLTNATCHLSFDKMNPQFLSFEIRFHSCDDTELKLLWGRLQRHLKNEQEHPEKTWIFYFHLLEKESVSSDIAQDDTLVIGHIMNPLMTYITRELPSMLSEEFIYQGDLMGGNIIKMLIPIPLFSYEISNEYNTSQLKGEARREDDARDYLDNYEAPKWNE